MNPADAREARIPRSEGGSPVATRENATMMALLGGFTAQGVGFTESQVKALAEAYGFDLDADDNEMMRAGAFRNLMRVVQRDGLRVMALLGKYLEADEDPVQLVAEALVQMGLDAGAALNEEDIDGEE